jgi:hypothetical protein
VKNSSTQHQVQPSNYSLLSTIFSLFVQTQEKKKRKKKKENLNKKGKKESVGSKLRREEKEKAKLSGPVLRFFCSAMRCCGVLCVKKKKKNKTQQN